MANPLATVGSTPYQMLQVLDEGGDLADEILSYFQPTCDCDAADWVKKKILEADPVVLAAIRTMIAADPYIAPPGPPATPATTILVSTKCVGKDFIGVYMTPSGATSELLIASNSPDC